MTTSREPVVLTPGTTFALTSGTVDVFIQPSPDTRLIAVGSYDGPLQFDGLVSPAGSSVLAIPRPGAVIAAATAGSPLPVVGLADDVARAEAANRVWEANELQRLDSRSARIVSDLAAADSALVGVLSKDRRAMTLADSDLAALDQVLASLGARWGARFPEGTKLPGLTDPVITLAELGGCRARPVALTKGWWRTDIESVIAFRVSTGLPVACIPQADGGYVIFDPSTGVRTPIAQVEDDLDNEGYALTAPLPKDVSTGSLIRFALAGSKGSTRQLVIGGLLAGVAGLATPLMTTIFYNLVIPQQSFAILWQVAALLVAAAFTIGLLNLAQGWALQRLEGVLQQELEPSIWNRMLRLPQSFFRQFTTGDLANRVDGIDTIRQLISGSILTALVTVIFASVNLVLLFLYDVRLALIALVVIVLMVFTIVALSLRNVRNQRGGFEVLGRMNSFLFQLLGSISKVRASANEPTLMLRWEAIFRQWQDWTYRAGRIRVLTTALTTCFTTLVTLVVIASILNRQPVTINSGTYLGFIAAAGAFTGAVASMAASFGPLTATIPLMDRLRPILEAPIPDLEHTRVPPTITGRISLRGITFRYDVDQAPVFSGLDLDIQPGEFVALTGPSGSGKSTLLKIMLGLEEPEQGSVSYDGVSLETVDGSLLRRQAGVVMQESRVMPGSIISALISGTSCTEDDAWAACDLVGIGDAIRAMPMGMRTMLSAGTGQISGGQMQLLVIARALITKPRVIFLDEATSALDDVTQDRVTQALNDMKTTRIAIAHRLSTIQSADRIIVIADGQVIQQGPFAKLAKEEGLFRELMKRQELELAPADT